MHEFVQNSGNGHITDIKGLRCGHFTDPRRPTGCTVILAEAGAVGGVDVRGGAPGTRETDLLRSDNLVEEVHAVVLSGGSAFGLDTATGVMRYLEERNIGYNTRVAKVPIVPAAILFDLGIGDASIRPDDEAGFAACRNATSGPIDEGSVGAGAGATVGKMLGMANAMKGGIGSTCFTLADGLQVSAIVAVNAVGDIYDPGTAQIIAGARNSDGQGFVNVVERIKRNGYLCPTQPGENTTIGLIATNANLDKSQATRLAQVGHDGLARTIHPVHTMLDGDTLFALATGNHEGAPNMTTLPILAVEAVSQAVVRAIKAAKSLPDIPSYHDLKD